ncbi:MAG: isopenicillin N synthase family dioxygenase [Candidatus Puniceispirillaceae bacterium]
MAADRPQTGIDTPTYAAAGTLGTEDIPVVDLAGADTPEGREAIGAELVRRAAEIGFFYVAGHGVSAGLCDDAMAASRQFFAMPEDVKAGIAVNQHQRGWMAQGLANLEGSATHDAKEVFFWGREVAKEDPDVRAGLPLVHPNQWPDGAAPFLRQGILPYYQAVMTLGGVILDCLARGLGADPKIISRAYDKPLGRGQLVYYPAIDRADIAAERFGAAPHTDFGVLTILQQDNLGGLQVLKRDGNWIEAMPIAGTFVCNIGDLLERWTNGRLASTRHRVLNRSGRSRFSIPIFCDPSSEAVIDPRDFDPAADMETMPPVTAGAYIAGKNRRNFSHYDGTTS